MADKTIRENFFDAKAVGALWDVAVSIKRGNPLPLESNAVFASYADLEAYASGPVAYPGHVVAVVNEDSTNIYYLDQNLAIQPIGAADGKSVAFIDGKLEIKGFKAADSLTLPQKQADGTIAWVPISQIVEGDGNTVTEINTVSGESAATIELITDTEDKKEYSLKINVSEEEGNKISKKADGLYVAEYDDTAIKGDIAKKADSESVYTKTETDELLAAKANADSVYTKEEANNLFGGAFHFRGEKESYAELEAIESKSIGDVYQVNDKEYAWDGENWIELGFNIDLSEYAKKGESYTKGEADNLLSNKANIGASYTKEEEDALLLTKASTAVTDNLNERLGTVENEIDVIQENIGKVYTKEEVNNLLDNKANSSELDNYAKSEDVNKTLEAYAKTENVNTELDKKLNASELEGINNRIGAKLDAATYEVEKENFAKKDEVSETIGQAPTKTTDDEGNSSWEGATGIYVNIYTKDEITDLIADITGGESAADVLAALNAYKTSTDPRIKAVEEGLDALANAEENVLEGIKVGGKALEIAEDKTVDIPVAGENLGVVKTSTAENGVAIDENGSMSVNSLNTNKLVQNDGEYIILYGGSATDNI